MAIKRRPTRQELLTGVLNGDRVLLSRAITLVESRHPKDKEIAGQLLDEVLPHTGGSIRIGVTGVPGVGKSTFIEAFGLFLTGIGKKLAVLSIDPSSSISQGSILGDKSRMNELSRTPEAFIRPSPTGLNLGGVAHATRETMLLCEAAGYDVVMVETVGVGQSETVVRDMVDFFLLLMLAGGGDDLQGIKRGIMEMADAVVINKADGNNIAQSKHAAQTYSHALHLFPAKESQWTVETTVCSALENTGIDDIWKIVERYLEQTNGNGYFENHRARQRAHWFRESLQQHLWQRMMSQRTVQDHFLQLENKVAAGTLSVRQALHDAMSSLPK